MASERHTQGAKGTALLRWIGVAMALPAVGAVLMLAGNASVAIREIDSAAIERETKSIKLGVNLLAEMNATEQMSYSSWDDAFENIVTKPDKEWMSSYFGSSSYPNPDEQHMVIVNQTGAVIFSSELDGPLPAAREKAIKAAVEPAMKRTREAYRKIRFDDQDFDKRQPGGLSSGVHANDLAIVEGKPAFVIVSPFIAPNSEDDAPTEPSYLVGIYPMTDQLLAKLAATAHVQKVELVSAGTEKATDTAAVDPHEQTLILTDADGKPVSEVRWPIVLPGTAVLKEELPVIISTLALIAAVTLGAMMAMLRLSKRVTASEEAALYAARHDAATGLSNRRWFMSVFTDLLSAARTKRDERRAVLLIDCDHFKTVNDTLGHAAGDAILAAVAERMKALDEHVKLPARLGGDEFALISAPLDERTSVARFAEMVGKALMRPVSYNGVIIDVSVSIGAVEMAAEPGTTIDDILARADLALYRAKRDGRGCARAFDPALDRESTAQAPMPRAAVPTEMLRPANAA